MTISATPAILDTMVYALETATQPEEQENPYREVEKHRALERLGKGLAFRLAKEFGPSNEVIEAAAREHRKLSPRLRHDITIVDIIVAAYEQYESEFGHAPPPKLTAACNEWLREQEDVRALGVEEQPAMNGEGAEQEVHELTDEQCQEQVAEAVKLIHEGEEDVYTVMRVRIPRTVPDTQVESVVASAYEQAFSASDTNALAA